MGYFLGIDAGGTKTHCLIGDGEGHILGFGKAGSGNYESYGVDAAREEISKAVAQALETAGLTLDQIDAVGMGIAGADIPEDYVMLDREIFVPMFGSRPRVFRNDSMAGLRGGLQAPHGIVIACGTGCVCAGRNRAGEETRVGGISEDYGDMVSGSSIGFEGLKAVWRARDEIIPPTLLTQKFLERAQLPDVEALFYAVYRGELTLRELQPMAKLVFDAAYEGDSAACGILEWGGAYLGQMVNAVARRLQMRHEAFQVVMAGSVFKGSSPVLIDAMRTVIHRECPKAGTVMPAFEPVVGALLLGMELDGRVSQAIYTTLADALHTAEQRYGVQFKAGKS